MASYANGQQPGSTENIFIDCKFEAVKALGSHRALRCDKYQFCAKITVSTGTVFELSLFEQSGRNKERTISMALLLPHTFAFSCLLQCFKATI